MTHYPRAGELDNPPRIRFVASHHEIASHIVNQNSVEPGLVERGVR